MFDLLCITIKHMQLQGVQKQIMPETRDALGANNAAPIVCCVERRTMMTFRVSTNILSYVYFELTT